MILESNTYRSRYKFRSCVEGPNPSSSRKATRSYTDCADYLVFKAQPDVSENAIAKYNTRHYLYPWKRDATASPCTREKLRHRNLLFLPFLFDLLKTPHHERDIVKDDVIHYAVRGTYTFRPPVAEAMAAAGGTSRCSFRYVNKIRELKGAFTMDSMDSLSPFDLPRCGRSTLVTEPARAIHVVTSSTRNLVWSSFFIPCAFPISLALRQREKSSLQRICKREEVFALVCWHSRNACATKKLFHYICMRQVYTATMSFRNEGLGFQYCLPESRLYPIRNPLMLNGNTASSFSDTRPIQSTVCITDKQDARVCGTCPSRLFVIRMWESWVEWVFLLLLLVLLPPLLVGLGTWISYRTMK